MSSFLNKKLDIYLTSSYNDVMNTVEQLHHSIASLPAGQIFNYADVLMTSGQREGVIKALNRMAVKGQIVKFAKGRFYRPEESVFGQLPPSPAQVVKDLLEKDGRLIGYLTGYSIYNQLGFTSQLSTMIQIGRNDTRPAFRRGKYLISFVKQKNAIMRETIPLLQILDAVRYQKQIPDAEPALIGQNLKRLIQALSGQDRILLAQLALAYQPFVRAYIGAVLESFGETQLSEPLLRSLNPITVYQIPAATSIRPAQHWNIR